MKESKQAKIKANRALALMLNMPLTDWEQVEKLDVRDPVGKLQPLPMSREELVKKGLEARPDLRPPGLAFAAPVRPPAGPSQRLPRRLSCSISRTRCRTTRTLASRAPTHGPWA